MKRSIWGWICSVYLCVKWHRKVAVPPSSCVCLGQEIPCAHLPWQLEMSQKQRDFKDHLVPIPLACSICVSGLTLELGEVFLCTAGQNCF